jgi:hypothetical protein
MDGFFVLLIQNQYFPESAGFLGDKGNAFAVSNDPRSGEGQ